MGEVFSKPENARETEASSDYNDPSSHNTRSLNTSSRFAANSGDSFYRSSQNTDAFPKHSNSAGKLTCVERPDQSSSRGTSHYKAPGSTGVNKSGHVTNSQSTDEVIYDFLRNSQTNPNGN